MSARSRTGTPAQRRRLSSSVKAAVQEERERIRTNLLAYIARMKTSGAPMSDLYLYNYHNGWNAALDIVRSAVEAPKADP